MKKKKQLESEIITVEVFYDIKSRMTRSDIENLLYNRLWPITLQGIRDRRDMHISPEVFEPGRASMEVAFLPAGALQLPPRRGHMQYRFGGPYMQVLYG